MACTTKLNISPNSGIFFNPTCMLLFFKLLQVFVFKFKSLLYKTYLEVPKKKQPQIDRS